MQVQLLLNPHPPAPARVLAAPAALSALSFDRPSLTGARPPLMAPQHICPTAPAGPSGPDVHLPPGRPLRQRRAALSTWKPLHPSSALREEGSQWPAGKPAGRTQGGRSSSAGFSATELPLPSACRGHWSPQTQRISRSLQRPMPSSVHTSSGDLCQPIPTRSCPATAVPAQALTEAMPVWGAGQTPTCTHTPVHCCPYCS